VLTRYI